MVSAESEQKPARTGWKEWYPKWATARELSMGGSNQDWEPQSAQPE